VRCRCMYRCVRTSAVSSELDHEHCLFVCLLISVVESRSEDILNLSGSWQRVHLHVRVGDGLGK
jgi:hypothetical protein